jgi:hypothetical protein
VWEGEDRAPAESQAKRTCDTGSQTEKGSAMSGGRANIVFFWDNLGRGEVGCYGESISIGAASYRKHHCGAARRPRTPGGSTASQTMTYPRRLQMASRHGIRASPGRLVTHGVSSRRTRPASTTRAIRKAPVLRVPSSERMLKVQKDHLGGKEK